jgi:hypothetical protein
VAACTRCATRMRHGFSPAQISTPQIRAFAVPACTTTDHVTLQRAAEMVSDLRRARPSNDFVTTQRIRAFLRHSYAAIDMIPRDQ